jgi:hypothetical protein
MHFPKVFENNNNAYMQALFIVTMQNIIITQNHVHDHLLAFLQLFVCYTLP